VRGIIISNPTPHPASRLWLDADPRVDARGRALSRKARGGQRARRALPTVLARAQRIKEIGDYGIGQGAIVTDGEAKDAIADVARRIERIKPMSPHKAFASARIAKGVIPATPLRLLGQTRG
jgi:hypothetical protein